ncbi:MAG: hypothetical protein HY720_06405 [Planctomycetes bacterium]|nr:hypothetical protein [Planctomycetota bacterium]
MPLELPELLAIMVCETVIRDERSKNISLIGTFNAILAPSFPCRHDRLHVYVSITNGRGAYNGEIRLTHYGEQMETLLKAEGNLQMDDPNDIYDLDFEFRGVVFPRPGKYTFEFAANGRMIGSRPFLVKEERSAPG